MAYSYDPELARAVPLLPPVDITDVSAARARLNQMVATTPTTVDASSLNIVDYIIPGHEEHHVVAVRVFRPRRAVGTVPHFSTFMEADSSSAASLPSKTTLLRLRRFSISSSRRWSTG